MLSLPKKKTEASASAEMSAWHPNFRNFKALPDTKTVRTSFLLTGSLVLIAAVLLTWCSYRAYQLHELTTQIDGWQQQIDRDTKPSSQAIALYKKFKEESAHVEEVNAFIRARPVLSDLIIHLGETLPSFVAIDRVDLATATMNIRGTVRGAPDQASGRASTYLQQLKADPFFTQRFSEISLIALNRDAKSESGLILDINFKLKAGAP